MTDQDEEQIQEFLSLRRHQFLGSDVARFGCRLFLHRAAEAERLTEILEADPAIAFIVHLGQAAWTHVLRELPGTVRLVVLAPERRHSMYDVAGIVAHELGHAFAGEHGKRGTEEEIVADRRAIEWRCGRFLLDSLRSDVVIESERQPPDSKLLEQLNQRVKALEALVR